MEFNSLPADCQQEVFRRLRTEDLITLSSVNRKWNARAYGLIKYAELRHLTSRQLISKLTNLEELSLNFFEYDAIWWFYGLTEEMLLLTNLKRLRVEIIVHTEDPSDITNPTVAPYFNILKQMTYLEKISLLTTKTPNLDVFFPGFSRLTSLSINAPFETDCSEMWKISSQLYELSFTWTNHATLLPLKYASNLTYLHIGFSGPKNRLAHMTNLKMLSVNCEGRPVPIESGDLTRLRQLESIAFTSYDDIALDFVTVLPNLVWLRSLELDVDLFTDEHAEKLNEISRLVNLTSLSVDSDVSPTGYVSHLKNLKRFGRVNWASELPYLMRLPNLEYLKYSGDVLGEPIESLAKLTSLTELDLENPALPTDIINGSVVDLVFDKLPRVRRLKWSKTGRGGMQRTYLRSDWKHSRKYDEELF